MSMTPEMIMLRADMAKALVYLARKQGLVRQEKVDNSLLMEEVTYVMIIRAMWSDSTIDSRFTYWYYHPGCTVWDASGHGDDTANPGNPEARAQL